MTALQRVQGTWSRASLTTLILVALGAALIAYILCTLFGIGGEEQHVLVANIGTALLSGVTALYAASAARATNLDRDTRRAWLWLSIAYLLMCSGELIWLWLENVLQQDPNVSLADFGYLAFYPAVMFALLRFPPRLQTPLERSKLGLDVAAILIGAGMAHYYFILNPLALGNHTTELEFMVAIAYPIGDLVLLVGVASVLLRQPLPSQRTMLVLLVTGMLVQLLGDLTYSSQLLLDTYVTGGLADMAWLASYFLVAVSAQRQVCCPGSTPTHNQLARTYATRLFSPLPYISIAGGYGLLTWVAVHESAGVAAGLTFASVLLTFVVVVRQVVAVRESIRLRAQAAARESEARFRSLVQNSSDVVTILDEACTIIYVSAAAERVLGCVPEALTGTPFLDRIHAEDRAGAETILASVTAGDENGSRLVWRFRHEQGNWLHLETTASNMLHDATVSGIVLNTRDVTERIELELQFRQAQKMEAIGRLAGGVAHDFNNLLTAIQGHSQLALENCNPTTAPCEELSEVLRAADRAAALTRQLLAFSRKQVLQTSVLDANNIVRDLEKMLRRLIGEHIELVTTLDSQLGRIRADAGQLEQVVVNLVVNARDAMPTGGRLTIETKNAGSQGAWRTRVTRRDGDGSFIRISVHDTGCGMSEETMSRIFEPFFTTKVAGQGTGLGLATVYGIVQQSGGTIDVESRLGVGTSMHIYLPQTQETETAAPVTPGRATTAKANGDETVLIVEDESAVRQLVVRVLRRAGYRVVEAENGTVALDAARAHDGVIDLLVTDMIMPGMNGRELAERFAKLRGQMPVLFMSGYSEDEIMTGNGYVPHAFIEKPFPPDALTRKVREVLDARVA